MKILIIIVFLTVLYFAVSAITEWIKGGKNPWLLGLLATFSAVITIFLGQALLSENNSVKTVETKENNNEKTDENRKVQPYDTKDEGVSQKGEEEGESSAEIDDVEPYTSDSISVDSIIDSKLAIDSNEDNAISFNDATVEHINGSIQNEEQEDSYAFTPETDGIYRFEFSNIPNNVSHTIYLYNSDGEELDHNINIGNEQGITSKLVSGKTYIVRIKHGWNTGSYTLNVGHQKPSQVISEYNQITDSIQFRDQENDYIFVPELDGLYRFEFSEIPNDVYHSMYIYNSDMEEIDHNISIRNEGGITASLKARQEYHIVVKQSENIGSYKLLIGKQKPTIDISGYTIVSDSIQYTNQENIYDFVPKNDGRYRFEFANIPNNISHSIYVYNSGFEELDKNTGIGNENGLSINLNANEMYHVVVKQSWNVGSYDLLVGSQKEVLDISNYASIHDSIQFTDQQNIYTYIPNISRDVTFIFSNVPDDVSVKLYVYNSKWEELDKNTGMGNESEITISVNEGTTYHIVVEQGWKYGTYMLNIY